jgi:hypothetical protein
MAKGVRLALVVAVLSCGLASTAAVAQTDFSKFPLIKAVPGDVFITVAARHNPERKFLDDYWAEVYKAFMASGITDDVWDLITEKVSDEQLDKIEDMRERLGTLFKKVDWGELFGKEMIYAGRMSGLIENNSPYEGLLIGRLESGKKAAANCENLKAILQEIVKLVEAESGEKSIVLGEVEIEGVKFTTFGPEVLPQFISVGSREDLVIVAIFNRSMLQDALALLKGSARTKGLIETEKFKSVFKQLPPAEDKLVFWDSSQMFDKIAEMIRSVTQAQGAGAAAESKSDQSPPEKKTRPKAGDRGKDRRRSANKDEGEDEDEAREEGESKPAKPSGGHAESDMGEQVITKILKDVAIIDYTATVEWTDGYQVFDETITTLTPDAKSKPLYGIMAGGAPIEKFERFIPEEATDFWRTSGISFLKAYRYIIGFVEEVLPEGKQGVAQFTKMFTDELQLDLEKDVLALLDGNMMTAKMGNDWILMLKVTDDKKASEMITSLLDTINKKLGEQNALMLSEVSVGGKKTFTQISHPMMMMMGGLRPPVIGVAEGHLILASSAATVTKCIETAAGKHPNITKNPRWKKEALVPKPGPVDSISFTDKTNTAAELQAMIGGLSMAAGMIGMIGQDMPPEVRGFISSVTPILAKLGPVAGKLDFYQSSAAYCTFDGKAWHERKVETYKEPKPATQPSEDEESSSGELKQKKDAGEKKDAQDKKESRRSKRLQREKTKEN